MLMRRSVALFGDRWATAHETRGPGNRPRRPRVPAVSLFGGRRQSVRGGRDRRTGLAALECPSIGFFGSRSATVIEGGPERRPRRPSVPGDPLLRNRIGNGVEGWDREIALNALTCQLTGLFGDRRATARGSGGRGTGLDALSVSFSISSEFERQRRDREETELRLHALSRQLLDLLGGRRAPGRGRRDPSTGPAVCGENLDEDKNPTRASVPANLSSRWVRILAGSKALELRGIVTFWFSEQKHTMSETARGHGRRETYGSAGGKRSEGRTPRAVPVFGSECTEGASRQEGEKP